MGRLGFWGLSVLLHVSPAAFVLYVGWAWVVHPAEFDLAPQVGAPLEVSLVHRDRRLLFDPLETPPLPVAVPEVEPPRPRHERPTEEGEPAVLPPPRTLPPEPRLDRPLRPAPIQVRRPDPEAAVESVPSVESETLPVQIHNPPPDYPPSARRRRLEGSVVLDVDVLEDGTCGGVRLVEGEEGSGFARSAVEAVRGWRFQPATRGGRPVRAVERIRFVFKLSAR
jgi:protein TonB